MTDVAKMEVRKRPQPTDSKEDTPHNSNEGSSPPLKVASKEKRGNEAFCQLQNHPFSRRCSHSLLSSESDIQNYRGFLNLAGIILFVTNFRLVVENLLKYGILINTEVLSSYLNWNLISWILVIPVIATTAIYIEKWAYNKVLSPNVALTVHMVNASLLILIPAIAVLRVDPSPVSGILLLMFTCISFLKLFSFIMTNRQFRLDLWNGKPKKEVIAIEGVEDKELMTYPQNLNLFHMAYFMGAPTLCYQLNYPRTKSIRWYWMTGKLLQCIFFVALVVFMIEQWCFPVIKNSVDFFKSKNIIGITERVMKLSIPSLYIWLAMFYAFFHLWLNIVGELLRFGDRYFYGDWYNAKSIGSYWRKWNVPTHNWLVRHLYYPALRHGFSKPVATSLVFLFSAIFHEVIISIPLHTFKLYFFMGMIVQIPAIFIGRYFEKSVIGNIFFWISFCFFGQPIGILLYYQDYISQH